MSLTAAESAGLAQTFREYVRWDWVYSANGRSVVLHHLATVTSPDDYIAAEWRADGVTACKRSGTWVLPGFTSRLGAPRCSRCCDRLGLPRGVGSPKNDDALRTLIEATS